MRCKSNTKQRSLSKSNTSGVPTQVSDKKPSSSTKKSTTRTQTSLKPTKKYTETSVSRPKPQKQIKTGQTVQPSYSKYRNLKSRGKNVKVTYNQIATEPTDVLRLSYDEAISRVFKILDIFSRGSISQANISKWVPEEAMYFLGSVFQKIRMSRVSMNEQQFKAQCLKTYENSSHADIRQFVQKIQNYSNVNDEKISVDGQVHPTTESRVQDKYSFNLQSDIKSFRRFNIAQKTLPLQNVRQSEFNFQQFGGRVRNSQENKIRVRNKTDRAELFPLEKINQFENVLDKNRNKRYVDTENLPFKSTEKYAAVARSNQVPACESPFFRGSTVDLSARLREQNKKLLAETDRIDKLSLLLADSIRQNAARLERSKNARIYL